MYSIYLCIERQHDPRLVALSACICLLGCVTTVVLLSRAEEARGASLNRWLGAAAAVFGCSVWSLHFVAMLAFMPELGMAYDLPLTALSAVIPVAGAFAAFALRRGLPAGGVGAVGTGAALAAGIVGAHYVGVAAMRFSGSIALDPARVSASVLICAVVSTLAAARLSRLARIAWRVELVGWLVLAICGLHYTSMSGLAVIPGLSEGRRDAVVGSTGMAIALAVATLLILLATLVAVVLERHLSQRLIAELTRMRLLSNLAHEVLLIHRDGVVLEMNSAGERLFGSAAGGLIGRPVLDLFTSASLPALVRRSRCSPDERMPEEVEAASSGGARIPVEISCHAIDYLGRPATAVALRDLSDRKRDEARIRHLARHDALTGLLNRHALGERLRATLAAAAALRTSVAVMYLDLDRFKPVNDLLGHAAGDALLVEVAGRLSRGMQPTDMLARLGGDEFVIVLSDAPSALSVGPVAARIVDSLRHPFTIEGKRVEIGASMGIALFPQDGETADVLLRAADIAMYRAKEGARGALRFYEPAMDAEVQARRQLEGELAFAVERGELFLVYQPIVNGATGEVETFEALIRWQHPERGAISPADFIPIAEQADLIGRIGTWVIDTACAAAATWPHPWRVSVNVSPAQFRRSDIAEIVSASLGRHRIEPARFVVEITEGVFIDDAPRAVHALSALRALGVRLALDDFGTGYSSLSYLQMFKFDKFKIDKSFVWRLGQNGDALTIINAIVNLGHNLGLQVTAEGVETLEQLRILQRLRCDQIQGYLVARPGPFAAFTESARAQTRATFAGRPVSVSA